MSNDDVWRNLKQRIRRGAGPGRVSSAVNDSSDRDAIDPIRWDWDASEPDPVAGAFRNEDPPTAAHSTSAVPVGYQAAAAATEGYSDEAPQAARPIRTSFPGERPVDSPTADIVAARRQSRPRQVVTSPVVSRVASDEDLERMACQLLFGISDQSKRRSSGSTVAEGSMVQSVPERSPIDVVVVKISLLEIDGLGTTIAERLAVAGYDSAQALALIDDEYVDDLAHEIGTFPVRVHGWVEHARELMNHPEILTALVE